MGNKNSFELESPPVAGQQQDSCRDGVDNPIKVLEGEDGAPPENNEAEMVDININRQNSEAPLNNLGEGVDDDDDDASIAPSNTTRKNELVCGLGSCRPRWLQWVAGGPKAFAFWSMLYFTAKISSGVYLGTVITTIEKQFQLSSTESSSMMIIGDIVEIILLVPVAYVGQNRHRPRLIGLGVLLAGIAISMCGVPHYILEPYTNIPQGCNETERFVDYCSADPLKKEEPCIVQFEKPAFNPVTWLFIGQILLGIGNVPMKPFVTTYIDDAVGKHTTPLYIAFVFIAIALGPLLGFFLGSSALSLFVDFDRVTPELRPTFGETDPRFIGAWWLGFVCIGCVAMALSIPFFFFPKRPPCTVERAREEREIRKKAENVLPDDDKCLNMEATDGFSKCLEVEKEAEVKEEEGGKTKTNLPFHIDVIIISSLKDMMRVLSNVGFVFLCLSSAIAAASKTAIGYFAIKYLHIEFALSTADASRNGLIIVPFTLMGSLLGGYIIKRRKWSPAKCALLIIFGDVVAILSVPFFLLLGCSTLDIAGVSTPYVAPAPYTALSTTNLPITLPDSVQQGRSLCNFNCTCDGEDYNPVCGSDGITYVSPCYAGCEVVESSKDKLDRTLYSFSDCRCINVDTPQVANATATDGECTSECYAYQLYMLIAVYCIVFFCTALGASGLLLITLRIVEDDMRAVALGFQSVLLNVLGSTTAPIYFGALFNKTCILWDYDDGKSGACWVYDREKTRYVFNGLMGALKLVSLAMLLGVYVALRTPKRKKYCDDTKDVK